MLLDGVIDAELTKWYNYHNYYHYYLLYQNNIQLILFLFYSRKQTVIKQVTQKNQTEAFDLEEQTNLNKNLVNKSGSSSQIIKQDRDNYSSLLNAIKIKKTRKDLLRLYKDKPKMSILYIFFLIRRAPKETNFTIVSLKKNKDDIHSC